MRYLRGVNLLAQQIDESLFYYLHNAHGDVIQRVGGDGNAAPLYEYDAFGNQKNTTETDPNPFRYCGEYLDKETGEYYIRARYYAPRMGRFEAEDAAKDGLNWYTYCGGNPVLLVDPSGLSGIMPDGEYYLSLNDDGDPMEGDEYLLGRMEILYGTQVSERLQAQLIMQMERYMARGEQFKDWSVNYLFGLDYYTIPDITDKLTNLMEEAVKNEDSRIELGYLGFAELVGTGKKYDLKSQDEWLQSRHYLFMDEVIEWDAPGNILYGYFGRSRYFTRTMLLLCAGAAQIAAGTSSWSYINSNFDDPRDQSGIKRGMDLYDKKQ